jgi:hypothetical protein
VTNTEDFGAWLNADTEGAVASLLWLSLLTAVVGAAVGFLIGRAR